MKTLSLLFSAIFTAQTAITPPENKYSAAQDVELGQKAAAEARVTIRECYRVERSHFAVAS